MGVAGLGHTGNAGVEKVGNHLDGGRGRRLVKRELIKGVINHLALGVGGSNHAGINKLGQRLKSTTYVEYGVGDLGESARVFLHLFSLAVLVVLPGVTGDGPYSTGCHRTADG